MTAWNLSTIENRHAQNCPLPCKMTANKNGGHSRFGVPNVIRRTEISQLAYLGFVHHRVILSDPKDSMKLLPWTHQLIANAKSVFGGPHRGVSTKHLQSYLSEVCYRFNRRFWYRQAFHRLLMACVSTTTVTRNELMAPKLGEQSQ